MPRIEIVLAHEPQAAILENLLELYIHDFSAFHDLEIGADGRFGYPGLARYWSERGRHPFLIHASGRVAGLVLVKQASPASGGRAVWEMAEFFVLRGYRRQGIGMQAAREVWRRFPGPWEVRVMQANISGRKFWARAISAFTGEPAQPVSMAAGGIIWDVFRFESQPAEASG